MLNINSIRYKTKKLSRFQFGYHGNYVVMAMRNAADAYHSKEPPQQVQTQYDLKQRSY